MKFIYCLIAILIFTVLPSQAQKVLQMERRGKIKTKKYYLGEELTFRLKGSREWITDVMMDIKVEEDLIIFSERYVKVSDIKVIKKKRRQAIVMERSLYIFAGSWVFYSLVGAAFDDGDLTDLTWQVPASSTGLGFLIRRIFYVKKYRMGKRRRLRVLDISFNKEMQLGY